VDPRVLVPRPETELVAEVALAALPEGGRALDLCTGSGVLAVTLALGRRARLVATDLSPGALDVARENARALGAEVTFLAGDLDGPVPAGEVFDLVVSNPPYVPSGEIDGLAPEVRREPRMALDGGPDGLAVLRRIVALSPSRLAPGGSLVLEMHETHREALPRLCREAGFARAEARADLAGLPRLVVATVAGGPAGA
jgi:release factor glutamine methyltransferase